MRRAHEDAVRLAGLRRILDKTAEALHQRGILDTRLEMMIVGQRRASLNSPCHSYRAIK